MASRTSVNSHRSRHLVAPAVIRNAEFAFVGFQESVDEFGVPLTVCFGADPLQGTLACSASKVLDELLPQTAWPYVVRLDFAHESPLRRRVVSIGYASR